MKLIVSARAFGELNEAVDYLLERNPVAAVTLHDQIMTAFKRLTVCPRSGSPTTHPGLRRVVLTDFPYTIYYRPAEGRIEIISIFANARDPGDAPAN